MSFSSVSFCRSCCSCLVMCAREWCDICWLTFFFGGVSECLVSSSCLPNRKKRDRENLNRDTRQRVFFPRPISLLCFWLAFFLSFLIICDLVEELKRDEIDESSAGFLNVQRIMDEPSAQLGHHENSVPTVLGNGDTNLVGSAPDQGQAPVLRLLPNGNIAGAGGGKSPRSAQDTESAIVQASGEKKAEKAERYALVFLILPLYLSFVIDSPLLPGVGDTPQTVSLPRGLRLQLEETVSGRKIICSSIMNLARAIRNGKVPTVRRTKKRRLFRVKERRKLEKKRKNLRQRKKRRRAKKKKRKRKTKRTMRKKRRERKTRRKKRRRKKRSMSMRTVMKRVRRESGRRNDPRRHP